MIVYLKYVEVEPIGSANQESGNNEKARWILLGLTLAMNGVYTNGPLLTVQEEKLTRMLKRFGRFIAETRNTRTTRSGDQSVRIGSRL